MNDQLSPELRFWFVMSQLEREIKAQSHIANRSERHGKMSLKALALKIDTINKNKPGTLKLETFKDGLKDERERGLVPPEYDLHLSKDGRQDVAVLTYRDLTLLGERQGYHQRGKIAVAKALCQILANGIDNVEFVGSASVRDRLAGKVEAIRSKSNPAMAVDAGSSTFTFIQHFMDDPAAAADRLVRPRIITNSTPIAEMVRLHHRRRDVSVVLVGGEMRVDHGSICGTLADMCLQKWDSHVDLAVVGTTAYNPFYHGRPAFGCDNVSEARLKTAMLESAMLRVILLDSSKVVAAPDKPRTIPHQHFCVLNQNSLDLVIVGGNSQKTPDNLTDFVAECTRSGVACLLAEH